MKIINDYPAWVRAARKQGVQGGAGHHHAVPRPGRAAHHDLLRGQVEPKQGMNCIKKVFPENWFSVREKVLGKSYSLENSLWKSIFREDLFLYNCLKASIHELLLTFYALLELIALEPKTQVCKLSRNPGLVLRHLEGERGGQKKGPNAHLIDGVGPSKFQKAG